MKKNRIVIKHLKGEMWDWSKSKFILTNNSNNSDVSAIHLSKVITKKGKEIIFNSINTKGLEYIDFQKGLTYKFEIYSMLYNYRMLVLYNVTCN